MLPIKRTSPLWMKCRLKIPSIKRKSPTTSLPGRKWRATSFHTHSITHTHTHITSHHGRRLCEPFNICLNNAAAFHKPGVVPRLTPPAAARARDIRDIYFSPSSVAVLSLFSPFYFSSLWPPFPVSPPAAPLIIRCTYCSLLLPRLPPFFSLWLSGSLLLLYKKVWIQM